MSADAIIGYEAVWSYLLGHTWTAHWQASQGMLLALVISASGTMNEVGAGKAAEAASFFGHTSSHLRPAPQLLLFKDQKALAGSIGPAAGLQTMAA